MDQRQVRKTRCKQIDGFSEQRKLLNVTPVAWGDKTQ
jgi:hypothetical protein